MFNEPNTWRFYIESESDFRFTKKVFLSRGALHHKYNMRLKNLLLPGSTNIAVG